jgi:hypothetical protein
MGEAGQLRNHCLKQDQARPRNRENPVPFQGGLQRGLDLGVLLGCRSGEGAQREVRQARRHHSGEAGGVWRRLLRRRGSSVQRRIRCRDVVIRLDPARRRDPPGRYHSGEACLVWRRPLRRLGSSVQRRIRCRDVVIRMDPDTAPSPPR